MASVIASLSRPTSLLSLSHHSPIHVPSSLVGTNSSASLSKASFNTDDDENDTVSSNRTLLVNMNGKQKSQDDLHYLAISTHITELTYAISDIQTRIFEIQELRHKSQSSGDAAGTTSIIDQSLMSLDERVETVTKGMKAVHESVEPLQPTPVQNDESRERSSLLQKHATLVAEWESVQDESEVLREELKEDKWLTVFRTVTEQADGMMSSLEKAVNRCQDFIWQVHRRGPDDLQILSSLASSHRTDNSPLNIEVFNALLESFEAKKKHYMPATSKVLSIIDKGVQDRVTKNGETLRRHAESAKRWRTLKDRIVRTDAEMEACRRILLSNDSTASENGSTASVVTSSTRNGYLATPLSISRASSRTPSASSTISRSMSPFRRFARKITGRPSAPATPLPPMKSVSRKPASEPISNKARQSVFTFRGNQATTPVTPERPGHKYSQSLTPESTPSTRLQDVDLTVKVRPGASKQKWNSSTKVATDDRNTTVKLTPRRRPSATGLYAQYEDIPPVPPLADPYRRSSSRSSMSSSRPWSPVTSSVSTAPTSNPSIAIFVPHLPPRSYTPARSHTPSRSYTPGLGATPRSRAKTPSQIPAPATYLRSLSSQQSDGSWDDDENQTTLMQRAFSPTFSVDGSARTPSGTRIPPPRPPSRSMIPLPSFSLSGVSRPSSAMSDYGRPDSRMSSAFRTSVMRAQTPEAALRAKTQLIPFYQPSGGSPRITGRPLQNKLPPSSFRDSSVVRTPGPSRPSSRAGTYTPTFENPVHQYVATNPKDPLDQEVAAVVNSIAHGLLVERVDPPLKTVPRAGEEIRAQYAFSNALSRKVVTCRLTTMTRSGSKNAGQPTTTKKVMCRIGGGWQDLHLYMLNRQAGL